MKTHRSERDSVEGAIDASSDVSQTALSTAVQTRDVREGVDSSDARPSRNLVVGPVSSVLIDDERDEGV